MSSTGGIETAREPLWLLAEMTSDLNTALDLDTLRLILSRKLRWLLTFDRCTLAYYPNPAEAQYTLFDITSPVQVLNHVPQHVPLTGSGSGGGWPGRVLADGKPRYLLDLAHDLAEAEPDAAHIGLCEAARSLMLLPLAIGERVLGVLCLSAASPGAFSTEFRTIGSLLAAQVAGQIGAILIHTQTRDALREMHGAQERLREMAAQLAHQASHDALTGLVNRREFGRRLADYVATARANNEVHTLCAIDLDHFKVVNDTCGHAAGDALLRQIATLVRMHIREADVLARLGGDEFAVMLPHCTAVAAERVVTAVRDTIRGLQFVWEGREFHVSGSVGVTEITAATVGAEEALRDADAACYVSKHGGRDRVSVYQPDAAQIVAVRGDAQ